MKLVSGVVFYGMLAVVCAKGNLLSLFKFELCPEKKVFSASIFVKLFSCRRPMPRRRFTDL